jgi:hypothetical protein
MNACRVVLELDSGMADARMNEYFGSMLSGYSFVEVFFSKFNSGMMNTRKNTIFRNQCFSGKFRSWQRAYDACDECLSV